jgi:hypothetical protein
MKTKHTPNPAMKRYRVVLTAKQINLLCTAAFEWGLIEEQTGSPEGKKIGRALDRARLSLCGQMLDPTRRAK